jgi:hypothetical protein
MVQKVVAMFLSHYPDIEREYLRGEWAPVYAEHEYDEIESESSAFAVTMVAVAMKDLGL